MTLTEQTLTRGVLTLDEISECPTVAIVGTRTCSEKGRTIARTITPHVSGARCDRGTGRCGMGVTM